jgi:hypothetical protein
VVQNQFPDPFGFRIGLTRHDDANGANPFDSAEEARDNGTVQAFRFAEDRIGQPVLPEILTDAVPDSVNRPEGHLSGESIRHVVISIFIGLSRPIGICRIQISKKRVNKRSHS